jgi:hypothetical protein
MWLQKSGIYGDYISQNVAQRRYTIRDSVSFPPDNPELDEVNLGYSQVNSTDFWLCPKFRKIFLTFEA